MLSDLYQRPYHEKHSDTIRCKDLCVLYAHRYLSMVLYDLQSKALSRQYQ